MTPVASPSKQQPITKSAESAYPLHPLLQTRWSPRAFDPSQLIESQNLTAILEAGRWAASCFNEQPWRIFVGSKASNPETFEALLQLLVPQNQSWVKNCPVLMLLAAQTTFTYNGTPNHWATHDVGLAGSQMVFEAMSRGIYSHWMAGFDAEKAVTDLLLPPNVQPVTMLAMGYPASEAQLDAAMREKEMAPRERKTLSEITFGRYYGQVFAGS